MSICILRSKELKSAKIYKNFSDLCQINIGKMTAGGGRLIQTHQLDKRIPYGALKATIF